MTDTSRHPPEQASRHVDAVDAAMGASEKICPDPQPAPDPHAVLLARLRERNAASESNYRIKSGDVP
ncbi:hypothetical protein [Streptomyces sp. NBRC 109706]|uniref:hypothetical protein n=1 Tax=Streptomyces sp. NBRC 109706 TaxID=1550035 RepID=UPI000783AADA|nr:hypothetical protein [Streptomyces sp. NBRC 109706]